MGLGKERYIDLDGDSTPEIRIVWNDVDRGSSAEAGQPRPVSHDGPGSQRRDLHGG